MIVDDKSIRRDLLSPFFYVMGFILPFSSSFSFESFGYKGYYSIARAGIVVDLYTIVLFFLLAYFVVNKISIGKPQNRYILYFLFYILINTIFVSVKPVISFGFLSRFINIFIIFNLIIASKPKHLICYINGAKAVLVMQLILGFYQFATGRLLGLSFLGERGFRTNVIGVYHGISGTLGHPGMYGLYLIIMVILLNILEHNKYSLFNQMLIFASLFQVVLTFSRTCIIIVLFVSIVYLYDQYVEAKKSFQKWIKANIIAMGYILLIIALFFLSKERFFQSDSMEQVMNRFYHWTSSFKIIKGHLWFGIGANTYQWFLYDTIVIPREWYDRNVVHNSFLALLTELGIIGLLFFSLPFFKHLSRIRLYFRNHTTRNLILIILAMLLYAQQGWGLLREQLFYFTFIIFAFLENCSLGNQNN
jgi:O-antigen ligase